MIHPDTIVRTVSPQLGNGVFAIRDIPRGTVVVVRDEFDICLPYEDFQKLPDMVRESMETHVFYNRDGILVLSWDDARFMNHSCCCNTMMTDYNLETAIRDIRSENRLLQNMGSLTCRPLMKLTVGPFFVSKPPAKLSLNGTKQSCNISLIRIQPLDHREYTWKAPQRNDRQKLRF